jgi:hypothetical protein
MNGGQQPMDSASLAKVIRRVEDWKLKLIDLSKRNRLVSFRPTRSSNVSFKHPNIDVIFDRLVLKDRSWEIWEPLDENSSNKKRAPKRTQLTPHVLDASHLRRILSNLSRRSVSEYRERGIRILYVTFGMLNWTEAGTNQRLKSPIVLTPVELTRETSRSLYRIKVPAVEEEAILNPALRLKLSYDYQIELPALPDFEEEPLSKYLKRLEEIIDEIGWEIEQSVQMGPSLSINW